MSGPVTLHLMRHGAPLRAGLLLGHTDMAATEGGVAACRRAATGLAFGALASSDLVRARACAEAVGADRGLTAHPDPRWRELDFGAWDGLSPDAVDADALAAFWRDPDGGPPPGGERWSALVARVRAALDGLGDATLVVTHAGAMRAALAATCGFDARQALAFDLPYACVLTIRRWGDTAQIVRLAA